MDAARPDDQVNSGGSPPRSAIERSVQWRSPTRTFILSAFVLIAAAILLMLYAGRIFDKHDMKYGEGSVTSFVERMGIEPVSRAWLERPPYNVTGYGPLYYETVFAVSRMFPAAKGVLPGRFVSFLSLLGVTCLIFLAVRELTRNPILGLVASTLFLASPIVWNWGVVQRVDMLSLLFSIGAFYLVDRRWHYLLLAVMLIVVGSTVKQPVVFASAPLALYLAVKKEYFRAGALLGAVGVIGIVAWALIFWATDGYFFVASIQANMNRLYPEIGLRNGFAFTGTLLGSMAILVAALFLCEKGREALSCRFTVGFLFTFALSLLLSCKEGASNNYFLEASALGAIVIGRYGLGRLWEYSPSVGRVGAAAVAVLCLAQWPVYHEARFPGWKTGEPNEYRAVADFAARTKAKSYLADGALVDAVLACGGKVAVDECFVFRLLDDKGIVSVGPLLGEIRNGRIGGLVLAYPLEHHQKLLGQPGQFWPEDLIAEMRAQYRLVTTGPKFYLYEYCGPK